VITILNTKKIKVSKKQSSIGSEAALLKLAVLRLIAGAVQVYCDTLYSPDEAVEAGLAKQLTPNKRATKLAKNLLDEIRTAGAKISWLSDLQRLADGEPFHAVVTPDTRIKAVVREISLLSHELFDINNNKASRFPTAAIHRILDIVGVSPSESTVVNHQRLYDKSSPSGLGLVSDEVGPLTSKDFTPKHMDGIPF
jgi:hypothetical protein